MEQITNIQQIDIIIQSNNQVPIFDNDNWKNENLNTEANQSQNIATETDIPLVKKESLNQEERLIMKRLQQEIATTKQNFFKVKVQVNPKKHRLGIVKMSSRQGSITNKSIKKQEPDYSQILSDSKNILKQGFVEKKSDGFFFPWKMRYMILTPQKLYSFQTAKKDKVIGCVNLKILPTKVKHAKKQQIILDFDGQCQNMQLRIQNQKQYESWRAWLQRAIKFQEKQNKFLLNTLTKPFYDSKDTLTQEEFQNYCETGDILLFQTGHTAAKMQRMFTSSNYDHVAMIVRFHRNDVLVFQSNPIDGVSVYEWNMFIKYFNLYEKVTIRRLNSVRKQQLKTHFLSFAKKNMGKRYDISAAKLLKFQSNFNWEDANSAVQQVQQRGYFCSELIAKAYKTAGLLEPRKSSAKYWPVDFSEKGSIKLKGGASLGSEQVIILNKHVKAKISSSKQIEK